MSTQSGGRGKNKRTWRKEEQDFLLDALVEMSVDPCWKGEGGFKNGFMSHLERLLSEKFPNCGLKAIPNVESKIKWFKDKHTVINEMLFRASGFKWDDEKKMVTCERQCYEEFCKVTLSAYPYFVASYLNFIEVLMRPIFLDQDYLYCNVNYMAIGCLQCVRICMVY